MDDIKGLTAQQAEAARIAHGSNSLTKKKRIGFLRRYSASFGDPIIKILMIALAVNIIIMLRDFNWYETVGIAVAVLVATLISTLSEYGSEAAFEKLNEEASLIKIRVKRDGQVNEIPIENIVVGDVVLVQSGERVPSDGIIIWGEISVDQSSLNGETKEARKTPSQFMSAPDFMSQNGLFRGSVVCSGEGAMQVTTVGDATLYGRLATEIQEDTPDSPLKTRLADLAKTISRFGYAAAIIVVLANLFNNIVIDNYFDMDMITAYLQNRPALFKDILRALTLGITVIVMAVPEGLPMMITVVLSANMRRMMKDNVLVRKLVGVETSGSLNILFTDKTGTLTKGQLTVTNIINGVGKLIEAKRLSRTNLYENVALNCYYNNAAYMTHRGDIIGGNSTDRALMRFVENTNPDGWHKGFIMPFNSTDKYSITEINGKTNGFLLKGAPEVLLPACVNALSESGLPTQINLAAVRGAINQQAEDCARVLALCQCSNKHDATSLKNLTLVGLLCIKDEIRKETRAAVREVTGAGIQVVMVTGDNKATAQSIARESGLLPSSLHPHAVLTSAELNTLSDPEVKQLLPQLRVIARALPSDKSRLVRLAQELGLVAGMTGDGVNDAPALKKADVGFAMGGGTEIAKEAGDIIILDNNIASISKAILYGRTIFKSIRKFLIFQLSINLCAVLVSVVGPFIGFETPVTVIQMLWINMIMDTLAGLAYAGEPPLPEYMKEPPKKRRDGIINRYMASQIAWSGIYTTILCLLFFKAPFFQIYFRGDPQYLMTGFFALFIFAGVFNSLNSRTYRLNLLSHLFKNKAFLLIMAMVSLIQISLIYFGGRVFRTSGLTAPELTLALALASTVILADLIRKTLLRANNRKGFI